MILRTFIEIRKAGLKQNSLLNCPAYLYLSNVKFSYMIKDLVYLERLQGLLFFYDVKIFKRK